VLSIVYFTVLCIRYSSPHDEHRSCRENSFVWGVSWSWSYGSWIYSYICNQYL